MQVGNTVNNFEVPLVNGVIFDLYRTLAHGPVVVNFIIGTWCPTCSIHLQRIRDWQYKNSKKQGTMLIVSSENMKVLKDWTENNQYPYLFGSDPDLNLIQYFQLKMPMMKMSRPATVLIDTDKKIKMLFTGPRTKMLKGKVEQACQIT